MKSHFWRPCPHVYLYKVYEEEKSIVDPSIWIAAIDVVPFVVKPLIPPITYLLQSTTNHVPSIVASFSSGN